MVCLSLYHQHLDLIVCGLILGLRFMPGGSQRRVTGQVQQPPLEMWPGKENIITDATLTVILSGMKAITGHHRGQQSYAADPFGGESSTLVRGIRTLVQDQLHLGHGTNTKNSTLKYCD
jgi:hypothetical protein